jgi:hypothetical protein
MSLVGRPSAPGYKLAIASFIIHYLAGKPAQFSGALVARRRLFAHLLNVFPRSWGVSDDLPRRAVNHGHEHSIAETQQRTSA